MLKKILICFSVLTVFLFGSLAMGCAKENNATSQGSTQEESVGDTDSESGESSVEDSSQDSSVEESEPNSNDPTEGSNDCPVIPW